MSERRRFFAGFVLGVVVGVLMAPVLFFGVLGVMAVPKYSTQLGAAQTARVEAELDSIDTSLQGLCSDAGRRRVADLFEAYPGEEAVYASAEEARVAVDELSLLHADAIAALLRDGRYAVLPEGFELQDGVRERLTESYLPVDPDVWGTPYRMFIGPWPDAGVDVPFRMYTVTENADALVALHPPKGLAGDDGATSFCGAAGKAPDHGVYVWSVGTDLVNGQGASGCVEGDPHFFSADDIGNWDTVDGWRFYY